MHRVRIAAEDVFGRFVSQMGGSPYVGDNMKKYIEQSPTTYAKDHPLVCGTDTPVCAASR